MVYLILCILYQTYIWLTKVITMKILLMYFIVLMKIRHIPIQNQNMLHGLGIEIMVQVNFVLYFLFQLAYYQRIKMEHGILLENKYL